MTSTTRRTDIENGVWGLNGEESADSPTATSSTKSIRNCHGEKFRSTQSRLYKPGAIAKSGRQTADLRGSPSGTGAALLRFESAADRTAGCILC